MAREKYKVKFTLVQHSGFGYGGKEGFAHGVEERTIDNKRDEEKVIKAGGLIFEDYMEAVEFEEKVNGISDPASTSLYPQAKGTFSDKEIDGLKIYIPVREAIG
jgi:hypothetical protein